MAKIRELKGITQYNYLKARFNMTSEEALVTAIKNKQLTPSQIKYILKKDFKSTNKMRSKLYK